MLCWLGLSTPIRRHFKPAYRFWLSRTSSRALRQLAFDMQETTKPNPHFIYTNSK
jgi:hypothetical protein